MGKHFDTGEALARLRKRQGSPKPPDLKPWRPNTPKSCCGQRATGPDGPKGGVPLDKQTEPFKITLVHTLSPGDVLVMSSAIRSLKLLYGAKYRVAVEATSATQIFLNNPDVEVIPRDETFWFTAHYPAIHQSNQRPIHFMDGFHEYIGKELGVELPRQVTAPVLHLSDDEANFVAPYGERVAVCNFGGKSDYTAKHLGAVTGREVVDVLRARGITPVQIGEDSAGHVHPPIDGAVNLVGKTTIRELIRLCGAKNVVLGVGPSTFVQHVFAAFAKPYVCVQSREPIPWVDYPTQRTIHAQGELDCCTKDGKPWGCWKSRTTVLPGNSPHNFSLCSLPVIAGDQIVPKCLDITRPRIIEAVKELTA